MLVVVNHGSNVIGAVVFPHNIGLGATQNPDLIELIGKVTAREVAATGIKWVFAHHREVTAIKIDTQMCAGRGIGDVFKEF